jgi:hypothetical protein
MKNIKKTSPIDWPQGLVLDIAKRRCVLFLGAGISCHAKSKDGKAPRGWHDFLNIALKCLKCPPPLKNDIVRLINRNDYLTACQVIKDNLKQNQFDDLVREEFQLPDYRPDRIHKILADLQVSIVATPNFDKVYEHQATAVPVKTYYDDGVAEAIRNPGGVILKIHGSVDSPQRMIFSRVEYAQARNTYRHFYSILDALALTHTFLFLGCGFDDPDIRLVLENYAFTHPYGRPHYYVVPKKQLSKHLQPSIEKSLNVNLLTYDSLDDHRLLVEALEELMIGVSLARTYLAKTQSW